VVQSRPLAHQAQDDAFREIQLNGKQLVFLFMVATVVSVVIFLCGVFVGRGVRAERAPLVADSSASTPLTTPDVAPVESGAPAAAGSDPTVAPPPPAVDELSYFNRLEKSGQPARDPKPSAQKPAAPVKKPAPVAPPAAAGPAPAARATVPPPEEPPASRSNPPAAATAASEPPGQGFALQVTALRERGEAEAIAKRLSSKGYTAYVLTPPSGTPSVYRVRVGKFKTRREAEAIATRLQKEEQFTPWITR
jgi:cell division septation protein DedD